LSSAIYSARYGIKTMVADIVSGGALATSPKVDNFPGFVSTSGKEIMDTIVVQAKESGASILPENIQSITKDGDYFYVISNLWMERVSSYEKIREDSLEKEEGSKEKIEEKVIWYKDIEDKEDFNKFINSWKKVSVTFSASWCPPCKILKSQLKESTKEWLSVVMDDDWKKCKDFSGRKIKSFPTTFIFENWKIIDTITWADYNWIINKILY